MPVISVDGNDMSFYGQEEEKELRRVPQREVFHYRHHICLPILCLFPSSVPPPPPPPPAKGGEARVELQQGSTLLWTPAGHDPRRFHSRRVTKSEVPRCLANPNCQHLSQKRANLSQSLIKGPFDHKYHL